jgi:membrane protein
MENLPVIKKASDWLFRPEKRERTLPAALHRAARIVYATVRDLIDGQLTLHAMSLVYTTLLSMVPLLALSFSVLKALGAHKHVTPLLESFFEPFGETGVEIVQNILGFVDNMKVGVLGFFGLVLLVYTVVSLVQKVERSFNFIWHVPQLRSLGQRLSNYLSVILIGPLLVVSAMGLTASIMSSELVQTLVAIEPLGSLFLAGTKLAPFVFIILAFTFVYAFMPNTKVSFLSALVGGIIGGVSWQMSSILFASFVVSSSQYQAIYSGFAVGIVLLIWVYVNWLILLLGASIAYYFQHSDQICKSTRMVSSPRLEERVGLGVMLMVAKCFDSNQPALSVSQIERDMKAPAEITRRVLTKLVERRLLCFAGEAGDCVVPARSLDHIDLADMMLVIRSEVDGTTVREVLPGDNMMDEVEQQLVEHFSGKNLADLIRLPVSH